MSILKTISQFCNNVADIVDSKDIKLTKKDFKIVYVAPMKALAAEIVTKMTKKLRWLGIVVKELTGDMQLTRTEIMSMVLCRRFVC